MPLSMGAALSLHSSGSGPRFPSPFAPERFEVAVGCGGESRVADARRRFAPNSR